MAAVQQHFSRELAKRYFLLHGQIELNVPRSRLVHYLLANCKHPDAKAGDFSVRRTQEEIAAAIGVTRETVNRHLQHLQRQGYLSVGRGVIWITQADALQDCTV